ncbi:MAG: tRNA epoxyqueuosine(34) reductase QueG [Phycisphaerales bacterium]|nr:tRNA epoxyqueuosine(34) reductase QueG [Phycisphaerales bacterium]
MTSDPAHLRSRDIVGRCVSAGFALAGVVRAGPSRWAEHLRAWLAAGKQGEMDYLEVDAALRSEPTGIMEGTRAFIVVADLYAPRGTRVAGQGADAAHPAGRIARYAQGRNYHDVMKRRLHRVADALRVAYPGSEFRTCVDTAPVPERELAVGAGLGWQAKSTMVIHPKIGSWFLLGAVATNLDLAPLSASDMPAPLPDACGTCTRCIDACPTHAITAYGVDARRCVSYLTIEHRSLIDPDLHPGIGDWLFGCDICQEVCPHNSARPAVAAAPSEQAQPDSAYAPRTTSLPLETVLGWTSADRERTFSTSAMKRATLAMMKRNAIIAAGNAIRAGTGPGLLQRIRSLAADEAEPDLVRATAAQVLSGLGDPA